MASSRSVPAPPSTCIASTRNGALEWQVSRSTPSIPVWPSSGPFPSKVATPRRLPRRVPARPDAEHRAATRSGLERRRNDDVFPERRAPHLGHVEYVLGVLDRQSPRVGLDGVPGLAFVPDQALSESGELVVG